VNCIEAVCCGLLESATWNVTSTEVELNVVPLITPVEVFSVIPEGSLPDIKLHVYGAVPPIAVRVCEYGVPATPAGSEVVVNCSGKLITLMVTVVVPLCCGVPESVTLKIYGVAPVATVGVPLICPVEALNVSPAGSVPAVNCQVYGETPPVAVRVVEHGVPTMQFKVTAGVVIS
jgi:hypothetical protein